MRPATDDRGRAVGHDSGRSGQRRRRCLPLLQRPRQPDDVERAQSTGRIGRRVRRGGVLTTEIATTRRTAGRERRQRVRATLVACRQAVGQATMHGVQNDRPVPTPAATDRHGRVKFAEPPTSGSSSCRTSCVARRSVEPRFSKIDELDVAHQLFEAGHRFREFGGRLLSLALTGVCLVGEVGHLDVAVRARPGTEASE